MPIAAKPPFTLSSVKNEAGQASMAHAAVALRMATLTGTDLKPDINCSAFVGKGLGNFQSIVTAGTVNDG